MAKRQITEEQRQKMAAAQAAITARRKIVLDVGPYQVFWFDEDNWVVRKGDDGEYRYYPTLEGALRAILHLRIGDHVHMTDKQVSTLTDVLGAVKKSEAEVVAAVAR